MKVLTKATIIILSAIMLMSCATLAAQPQDEPDAAVAATPQTKAVDAYVFVPRKAEDTEKSKATITGDDDTVRWVPVKVQINVPVTEETKATED